jgi:glutathione peroxidase-family protein
MSATLYDFKARTIQGKDVSLAEYKGSVVLVVNTASKCGFTPQYAGLQKLYETYRARGTSSGTSPNFSLGWMASLSSDSHRRLRPSACRRR